ncbi:GNAT family N-acetyltransferase [Hyphomicrobium sp.]|jgi:ribosomal protein S18 acetylase RimI-like enzyme|uniref:GNAT family N-acetyltransferase n=1 Tax=Hyphomicrobium sp. TaxID=82 RepID=UPI0035629C45
MSEPIAICRYPDIAQTPELAKEIDAIFFEASNTKSFVSDDARAAFRERWLGRYLTHDPALAFLARTGDGTVVGYIVGSVDDPAKAARFSDIGYFADLAEQTERFPAHLHVNISPGFRNQGIGGRLIDRFVAAAKTARAPGVHVVTSVGAENVGFYNRNGFSEVARAGKDGRLVFLARTL